MWAGVRGTMLHLLLFTLSLMFTLTQSLTVLLLLRLITVLLPLVLLLLLLLMMLMMICCTLPPMQQPHSNRNQEFEACGVQMVQGVYESSTTVVAPSCACPRVQAQAFPL